ncbi:DUF6702 family protein [Flammeovirgaceae bacterium SG7u.111]|nr:DUF6702 family protein [Flammeovirgaceae bacterium SG7u.132]WPO37967.1 DUF6702 family protein [Flammeovirgaceae bacterium SG7u.111]
MSLLTVLSIFLASHLHPVHMSLTYVSYNEKTNAIEISHKIFIDDFETALAKYHGGNLHLTTKKENPDTESIMTSYLKKHFTIKINNKKKKPGFVGKEYDIDAVWIYQEITDLKDIKNLEITNNVLQEMFEDQKNLIHIDYLEHKNSMMLEKGKATEELNF